MKRKIFIFVLFILPSIICSKRTASSQFKGQVAQVNKWAAEEKNSIIGGVLKLKEDGFLYDHHVYSLGFFYEGTFLSQQGNRTVAIRIVDTKYRKKTEREMRTYIYLKAYRNEEVLKYGIPVVYYYGIWGGYTVTAFTKLDMNLEKATLTDVDAVILLRDFLLQTKWMHSHGVRHNHIIPRHIMKLGHRYFLIGFDRATKIVGRHHKISIEFDYTYQCAMYDYESFLNTISIVTGKHWFPQKLNKKGETKELSDVGLEGIVRAFAEEIWPKDGKSKDFPDYNKLADKISEAIARDSSLKFSSKTNDAETSAEDIQTEEIKKIQDPKDIDFVNFKYPEIPAELPIRDFITDMLKNFEIKKLGSRVVEVLMS